MTHPGPESPVPAPGTASAPHWLNGKAGSFVLLLAVTVGAYYPALRAGFIWNDAARHGKRYRIYGEYMQYSGEHDDAPEAKLADRACSHPRIAGRRWATPHVRRLIDVPAGR